ncbi:MAG: 2-succinyl-5-enolpyruvyl-6-hydroxy-3-cyclohexene-1-carboxylic-acid synthase [Gemmatimonadota bacterium]|nr:2-succinyl-5-enolpyruvyl-6-hydroxy-3-cyclohexene-1-carboxylic-acid synthase [Gemmatimonadota bacterium]
MNVHRAADLVTALAAVGVRDFCVCPGGRNAPLVVVLARATGITVHSFFDERAAAYFALGRAKDRGAPVAVVTTSGTAAAELLPATVEAYYSGVPLILVTADRPPSHRGTGSPQAIEQVDLFGIYAPTVFDGAYEADRLSLAEWNGCQPAHVNICFDEPLVESPVPTTTLAPAAARRAQPRADVTAVEDLLGAARRPLVVVGPLDATDRDEVRAFLQRLRAPVYAEPASGLREDAVLDPLLLTSGEGVMTTAEFDAVLRLGGVPALRLWRDLETVRRHIPVCSVSRTSFAGLTRGTHVHAAPGPALAALDLAATSVDDSWRAALLSRDRARARALGDLWAAAPGAEPTLLRALSRLVPHRALVYLGNSLPIREWDLAAVREPHAWNVAVNRGANGIDGQLSTFLGMCAPGREHWAVVGDLTALYDLAAPWILPAIATGPIRIVIVNNGGGQIFARLSPHPELRNEHGVTFERWAAMWGLHHLRWDAVPDSSRLPERCVIELAPDPDATMRFWRAYDALD